MSPSMAVPPSVPDPPLLAAPIPATQFYAQSPAQVQSDVQPQTSTMPIFSSKTTKCLHGGPRRGYCK
ncbi:hypothetical protein ACEPAG_9768 [Sanghuangporus baumii]